MQYKCKDVFAKWRKIAKKFKKPVLVNYDVSGHGKGLIDAVALE